MERIKKYLTHEFDDVSNFRMIFSFYVAIYFGLMGPIWIVLKGLYMLPWLIGIFSIIQTLSLKSNKFFIKKFSLNQFFRVSIIVHVLYLFIALTYFISPHVMIIIDSALGIFDVALFSAFSIKLDVLQAKKHPEHVQNFKTKRNSRIADGTIIGTGIMSLILFFNSVGVGVMVIVVVSLLFLLLQIKYFNFYKERGL
jgi:hypothetical protein